MNVVVVVVVVVAAAAVAGKYGCQLALWRRS